THDPCLTRCSPTHVAPIPSLSRPARAPRALRIESASTSSWVLTDRGLLHGLPVHPLADQVGMAVVARVLLDQVAQDPAQARRPTIGPFAHGHLLQAAACQRLSEPVT